MRPNLWIASFGMLVLCWCAGVELGLAKTSHDLTEKEKPYRALMQQAVDGLNKSGISVAMPAKLPALYLCSACLAEHESFGAYVEANNQIVMPDDFNVTTTEGRSTLIHEYGHVLRTEAGIPDAEQEPRCLMLGNSVMQKFFQIVLDDR